MHTLFHFHISKLYRTHTNTHIFHIYSFLTQGRMQWHDDKTKFHFWNGNMNKMVVQIHKTNTSIDRKWWWRRRRRRQNSNDIHFIYVQYESRTYKQYRIDTGVECKINAQLSWIKWCWKCRSLSKVFELRWHSYKKKNSFLCIQISNVICTFYAFCRAFTIFLRMHRSGVKVF